VDIPGIHTSSTPKQNLFGRSTRILRQDKSNQPKPNPAGASSMWKLAAFKKAAPRIAAPSLQPIQSSGSPMFLVEHAGCPTTKN
jgi:hypothetical protein